MGVVGSVHFGIIDESVLCVVELRRGLERSARKMLRLRTAIVAALA